MTRFPLQGEILDGRLTYVGTSGSGKSYGAGLGVEHLLRAGARVGIVDPLGVWWGLRLRSDGRRASRWPVVIFGGRHGDLPLTEAAGRLIGETAAGMAESFIVDLSELGTKASERRFMIGLLESLYRKASGEPLHLVFDEADLWAPQRAQEPQLQALMENIVRRGRVKGFVPWLITQRPAVLSKDVLSQADALVAFKLTASHDRDALGAWIEGQADRAEEKRILARLPQLETGQAVIWAPGHSLLTETRFPLKTTFDSSRTPKRGEARATTRLTPLEIGPLRERLAALEGETKANDPAALKAEIARLRKAAGKPDEAAVAEAEERGFERGIAEGSRRASLLETILDQVQEQLGEVGRRLAGDRERADSLLTETTAARSATPAKPARRAPRPAPPEAAASPPPEGLTAPQIKVLGALMWWRLTGQDWPTRAQVAIVAGWSPKSSNIRDRVSELVRSGHVARGPDLSLQLTEAGTAEAPRDGFAGDVRAHVRSILTKPQVLVLDALLAAGGPIGRDDLSEAVGWSPSSSNIRDRLSELVRLDIARRLAGGLIDLAEWVRA